MDDLETLHQRLKLDPRAHLGRKSVRLIHGYEFGYDFARLRWGRPPLPAKLSHCAFQDWTEARFGWTKDEGCRQNPASFALLLASDEHSAFDLYFDLYDAASRDVGRDAPANDGDAGTTQETLLEFLTGEFCRARPGMYFGSPSLDALWAFCSGYLWAEQDMGVGASDDRTALDGFQRWVEARYSFTRGCPWNRVLHFLALHSPERGWASFFEMFAMFRAGEKPDALSETARTIISNITANVMSKHPHLDPDDVAGHFTDVVKRQCPS
jgi:hypothetical protein